MPTPHALPWEKTAAAALAAAPAVWLAWLAYDGGLGARPVTEAIRMSGDWALRLLWLVLLIGPARRILGLPRLVRGRRILGIGAFGLAALHFGLYALDLQFDWIEVARETVLRLYLTIGAVALIGLAALAATSSDRAIARLGSARWNRLHSAIYVIAALSVLHFLLRSRTETFEPMLMLGLLIWLVGLPSHSPARRRRDPARTSRPRRVERSRDGEGRGRLARRRRPASIRCAFSPRISM